MTKLKAFTVTSDYVDAAILCFAPTASKAKGMAMASEWHDYSDYIDLKCRRQPDADKYAERYGERTLEADNQAEQEILRDLGWFELEESMTPCVLCDLYQWSKVPQSQLQEVLIDGYQEYACQECIEADSLQVIRYA